MASQPHVQLVPGDPAFDGQSVEDPLVLEQSFGSPVDIDEDTFSAIRADITPLLATEFLGDLQKFAEATGVDPLDLLVSETRQQGAALLRLHQDICDGVELATEQVQDKRIEFLERGPEVKVEDIFLVIALTLLLESPLVGAAVGVAFRFAGDQARALFLASRSLKLARLQQRTSAVAQKLKRLRDVRANLSRVSSEAVRSTGNKRRYLESEAIDLRREIRRREQEVDSAIGVAKKFTTAAKKAELSDKSIKEFLSNIRENSVETGVAALKATVAAKDKSAGDTTHPESLDSIGVQLRSLAQGHLRDMEGFFGQINADAELVRGIARTHPYLREACLEVLAEVYVSQQGTSPRGDLPADVKRTVALEIEKLVWAILSTADLVPPIPPLPPHIERLLDEETPASMMREGPTIMPALERRKPPSRLIAYWRGRFFRDNATDDEIIDAMREVRDKFLEKSESPSALMLAELAFKPEILKAPANNLD